jgi:nitric oxide reductase NorQ protein
MKIQKYEDYAVMDKPYYEVIGNEVQDFTAAFLNKRPLALIGPTGCGKSQLAMYMAYTLRQNMVNNDGVFALSKAEQQHDGTIAFPYIEVPCHEDLTETYLVGRHGLQGEWLPGPLYTAAKHGGICVLDEVAEARKDMITLLHSLTDDRRVLPVAKNGEVVTPPDHFMLVVCYNPGYQLKTNELKPSTRQRFPTIQMDYPNPGLEAKIVQTKTGVSQEIADTLAKLAYEIRSKRSSDEIRLQEGASTRLLIMAAEHYLAYERLGYESDLAHSIRINIFNPISNEETDKEALEELMDV